MSDSTPCYYVYELVDPRDGSVFYVGKGKGNRIRQHVAKARNGGVDNPFKIERIVEIIRSGHDVVERKVHEGVSEAVAFRMERRRIALYGIENLTNISAGMDSATEKARQMLLRVKPFDQWMAEKPIGLDGKVADPVWYHRIVAGLRREAGLPEQVS